MLIIEAIRRSEGDLECHTERSKVSISLGREMLRGAQHDSMIARLAKGDTHGVYHGGAGCRGL